MPNGNGQPAYASYTQLQKWTAFNKKTNRFWMKMPSHALSEDSDTCTFILPKNRFTSRVRLMFEGTVALTHASATSWASVKHRYAPYNLIKKVRVNASGLTELLNISGIGLALMNMCRPDNEPWFEKTVTTHPAQTLLTDLVASSSNTVTFKFCLDVDFTLNEQSYFGILNTSDQNLNVEFKIETGNAEDMFTSATGYTVGTPSWTVTPLVETFSPVLISDALENANPSETLIDFDIVKVVDEKPADSLSAGENIIKMPCGQIYRRIILDLYGAADYTALTDAQITNVIMAINQSLISMDMTSYQLRCMNHALMGGAYNPKLAGILLLEFGSQGFCNYGGSRDYIDTYGLNEFWIKLQAASGVTGSVKVYSEKLMNLAS